MFPIISNIIWIIYLIIKESVKTEVIVTKGNHFELDFYLNETHSFPIQPNKSENLARMAFLHDCMDAAVRRPESRAKHRCRDITN